MVTLTPADAIPLVTTFRVAAPRVIVAGMSNCADTILVPVATPELKL